MHPTCTHLDQIADVGPGAGVCPTRFAPGATWVNLRQCLICGETGCCDSSPNTHATKHFRATGHPVMRSVMPGQDWSYCYVDEETIRQAADGSWQILDSFFDAGLWFARQVLGEGAQLPFPANSTAGEGFPLGVWERTYRERHRSGALSPEQAADLEALPGWRW
jgi:hypothetical protein